ncbi:MAG: imidazole glycerol phosphate synthase cyclase subunit, partial [Rhodospirillales bacterium]|nr:imidazole glycerol phosphate synthase cyclase subunit [Rhodospirillales bacterium]
ADPEEFCGASHAMLKTRVIPVLFLMNGLIVRSEGFREFKVIGNPVDELARYSQWRADELVYVDISREDGYDFRRDDHKFKGEGDILSILRQIARAAFMPLTFGGRISDIEQVNRFLLNGADKVVINSAAWRDPALVTEAARRHGSQAIVVGIDVKAEGDGHAVYVDQGRTKTDEDPVEYARRVEAAGAGEIFLNSIDRDGTADGYDVAIIRKISDAVSIPVIACGGVGMFGDFGEAIDDGGASAVAAGNIFHFTENSYKRAKKHLHERGYVVRYPYPA